MLFNSIEFIFFFLPAAYFIFLKLSRRNHVSKPALIWLLGASLFFYSWWNPKYLILIVASMLFNYFAARILTRLHHANRLSLKRFILFAVITANLLLLGYYKYAFFLIGNVNVLFGTSYFFESLVLPLGISFFTFQQIAYLVDVYRLEVEDPGFLNYCLVVTFFPHLIAGPIVHYRDLIPQFARPRLLVRNRDIAIGLTIFVIGLFKKVVLADTVSIYARAAFDSAALGQTLPFFKAWGGLLAYSLQIYFDFSGYSDMAVGLGRLFGIKLPVNFNSPYKATGIIDFWRRWHITLSDFLLRYVYIPLGGNRKGVGRQYLNLMVTMLLGGLWHGAGWTYVVWGGLHGVYLTINHLWRLLRERWFNFPSSPWSSILARTVTLSAVIVAWVFFRAKDINSAVYYFGGLAGINGFDWPKTNSVDFQTLIQWGWILILFGITCFFPNTQQWLARFKPALNGPEESLGTLQVPRFLSAWYPTTFHAIFLGMMAALCYLFLFVEKNSEFIYFQF